MPCPKTGSNHGRPHTAPPGFVNGILEHMTRTYNYQVSTSLYVARILYIAAIYRLKLAHDLFNEKAV